MKIGLSTYSMHSAMQRQEMTVFDVIEWIAENGGEHVEIVPIGFTLHDNLELADAIREKAKAVGIDISNYAIGANFIQPSEEAYEAEIERVKRDVDAANRLGIKLMRHDVAWRAIPETSIEQFELDLPKMVEACQRVADYAAPYGITTSVENHGFFVQASDRVQRLIGQVNRPNFKTTLDIGNFLCVDEDSLVGVQKNIKLASMVHVKDFYYRPSHENPGQGWFRTSGGNYLRGAIAGHGDIDMRRVLQCVKASGYDGYISIEFEGMEDCRLGSKIGMDNVRRIWDEV